MAERHVQRLPLLHHDGLLGGFLRYHFTVGLDTSHDDVLVRFMPLFF
jgi:hypothetical protein